MIPIIRPSLTVKLLPVLLIGLGKESAAAVRLRSAATAAGRGRAGEEERGRCRRCLNAREGEGRPRNGARVAAVLPPQSSRRVVPGT